MTANRFVGHVCKQEYLMILLGWLYWGLTPFNSKGHIMAVGDAYVFLGFLTPVLTQLFLPKPPTTFLTCFCREYLTERR